MRDRMITAAVIVAGGQSLRFGGEVPKQFREVAGRPLLAWTISRFEAAGSIDRIVVVAAEDYLGYAGEQVVDRYGFAKVQQIVSGGTERRESVWRGLEALPIATGFVAIHDGARPLVRPADIDRVVGAAKRDRAAILAVPVPDTLKRVRDGYVIATVDRSYLYGAQTPQVFQYDLIMAAHREAAGAAGRYTDDASMVESRGFKVTVVEPSGPNIKITTPEDLVIAEALLAREGHG
ncbi:MAG TPA: 2-C-methyl-D-erythritol 4-phosphate cytidylyltransferase [candidate division Zixibacteria bacterium]|nr:2-C-methyl-D-erythritol 4-phosphate cytidylyltransferase [candidate division Zixibacteria bacterium]MDD4918941.1 2-C-methyl-D-erythritol 4-phosphate cytidylyltransferase [candidate division Zixibacteria bacterium]MDM7973860.1 2-C-methyl-D-erythritol 4-phosphate cytidylyltransferase [candidate division Zixibacteria bacterium]HOD67640.1 2-C-methyl-D-erythritol 4-phosphate cytidylyltransferase [candidate division Zixibacteria bacterium]HOZ07791.1 2-C-methyl-D-erythritol 4-phosphate cytidylyltra